MPETTDFAFLLVLIAGWVEPGILRVHRQLQLETSRLARVRLNDAATSSDRRLSECLSIH
jgi:hypothetical protein